MPWELISDKAIDIVNKSDKHKTNLLSKKNFLLKLTNKIERQIEAKKSKLTNLLVLKISNPITLMNKHVHRIDNSKILSIIFILDPILSLVYYTSLIYA